MKVKSESEVAQSCLTLSDPMDCSLPGSSVHGIFQARVLEWVPSAFSLPTRNGRQKDLHAQEPYRALLDNFQFILTHESNTEKAMAPHSSTLAWKIPWMEEPDRLQSMVSLRVGHD